LIFGVFTRTRSSSRCDNDRTKFIIKFVGKHVLFDMTYYHPFPLLGMVVSEHGAAEICVDVTGNVEKTYVRFDCLDIVTR